MSGDGVERCVCVALGVGGGVLWGGGRIGEIG